MSIEERIKEIHREINEVNKKINDLHKIDYDELHQYTDRIYELKRSLQKLEKNSYLERKPDIVSDEIDLYIMNIHDTFDDNPDKFYYIITLHNTKTKIGEIDIRFNLLESEKYLGNLGANINEEYRGKRYSKKAFIMLRDVMLERGLKKPIFTVMETNISSIKSLQAIGAEKTDYINKPEGSYYVYEYDLEESPKKK